MPLVVAGAYCPIAGNAITVGTSLYLVTHSRTAPYPTRMMKSTNQGASWTEMDSANRPSTNITFTCGGVRYRNGIIYINRRSATNTLTVYRFDTSTDTWTTSIGNATTAAQAANAHYTQLHVRSDNDVLVVYTSSADPSDLMYARYEGSWNSDISFADLTSGGASRCTALLMDRNDIATVIYNNDALDDMEYRTIDASNVVSAASQLAATTGDGAIEPTYPQVYADGANDYATIVYPSGTYPGDLNAARVLLDGTAPHATITSLGVIGQYDAQTVTWNHAGTPYVALNDYNGSQAYRGTYNGSSWGLSQISGIGGGDDVVGGGSAFGGNYVVTVDASDVYWTWISQPTVGRYRRIRPQFELRPGY